MLEDQRNNMGGVGSGSVNAALMRIGEKTNKDGSIEESNFFDFLELPDDDYSDIELTPKQAIQLRNYALRMKFGTSATMPLRCIGPKCPIKSCPFKSENNYPLGRSCPIELRFIQAKMQSYMEDLSVTADDITDMSLINRLVEIDLMDFRANAALSADEEAQTLLYNMTTSNGDYTSETIIVHPILEIKEKHHRQRMQILEAFAATRREKYKKAAALKKGDSEDAAHHMAKMKKAFDQLTKGGLASIDKIKKEAENVNEDEETDWEVIKK